MNDGPCVTTEHCECEQPGDFHSGVAGVLAYVEDGHVVPGCRVERCDFCRRFPSDAEAEARLRELGLFLADDPRSKPTGERRQTYSVHCYVIVRVKLPNIEAADEQDAARQARDMFDWDRFQSEAEFADDFTEFLVDVDGGADFSRSRRFTPMLEEIQNV